MPRLAYNEARDLDAAKVARSLEAKKNDGVARIRDEKTRGEMDYPKGAKVVVKCPYTQKWEPAVFVKRVDGMFPYGVVKMNGQTKTLVMERINGA